MSNAEYQIAYYHRKRAEVVAYLGGKCVECGTEDDLEIDHIDPATKSFEPGKCLNLKNPLHLAEIEKCQLLCREHHRVKTAVENTGITHGSTYAWSKAKCLCSVCQEAQRVWSDARNAARRGGTVRGPYKIGPAICGERKAYQNGCRCEICRAGNAKRHRDYMKSKRDSLNQEEAAGSNPAKSGFDPQVTYPPVAEMV